MKQSTRRNWLKTFLGAVTAPLLSRPRARQQPYQRECRKS